MEYNYSQSQPFPLFNLPDEIILNIIENADHSIDSLRSVDKRTRDFINDWFINNNKKIIETYPPISAVLQKQKNLENRNENSNTIIQKDEKSDERQPIDIFMTLVDNLHSAAAKMGCNIPTPNDLSKENKLSWECNNIKTFLDKIESHVKIEQEKAFKDLVGTVAEDMINIALAKYTGLLKADKKADPYEVEKAKENLDALKSTTANWNLTEPEQIEQMWKSLLKNPLIDEIKKVNLSNKNLRFIPPEIGDLPNLHNFMLQNNLLTNLPTNFGELLPNLEVLNLANNQLESFQGLDKFKNQQLNLNISGNPKLSQLIREEEDKKLKAEEKTVLPLLVRIAKYINLGKNPDRVDKNGQNGY